MSVQFDRYGGGFVIELAEAAPGDLVKPWGKIISGTRLHALNINPPAPQRLQPGSVGGTTESWFASTTEYQSTLW